MKTKKSRTCLGRVSGKPVCEFRSEKEALKGAEFAELLYGKAMCPYRCNRCGKWHLSPAGRQTPSFLGSCTDSQGRRKRSYQSSNGAERRAEILRQENGQALSVYACDCGHWHLTSKSYEL